LLNSLSVTPLVLFLLCLAFLGAAFGGYFKVREVQVVGTGVPVAQIVSAADVQGRNIFRVRGDGVVTRLQSVRQVVVTKVETDFPGKVVIYARMREQFAAWRRNGKLYVVDPNGTIIQQVTSTTLPIISGPAPGDSLGPGVVQSTRYALATLPAVPYGRISAIQFGPKHGMTIVGQAGWQAILGRGTPHKLDTRIAELAAVLRKEGPKAASLKIIDLRLKEPYATGLATP
jgi:cell division septal protein FtsQ